MAKQTIYGIGLLPSRRALRVVKMDARRMLEVSNRIGAMFAGKEAPSENHAYTESQKQTIAMCVRGITQQPVELKMSTRPPTEAEVAAAFARKETPPTEIPTPDIDATLKPYATKEAPEFKRWTPLGEQQLANDSDDNEFCMFTLFEDPAEWRGALRIIDAAGGGGFSASPFEGKVLKTSAG